MDDIKKYGEVKRAILGVRIQDITSELADREGLKEYKGVFVPEVVDGSAADKAGIKKGDVILKINDVQVNSSSELQEQVSKYYPGQKVNLFISRNNSNREIEVTLRSKDGKTEVEIKKLTKGPLQQKGIPEGFIITAIDKKPIYSVKDVKTILNNKKGATLIDGILPDGSKDAFAVRLD